MSINKKYYDLHEQLHTLIVSENKRLYRDGYKQGYVEGRKVLTQELDARYGNTKWRADVNV